MSKQQQFTITADKDVMAFILYHVLIGIRKNTGSSTLPFVLGEEATRLHLVELSADQRSKAVSNAVDTIKSVLDSYMMIELEDALKNVPKI